MMSRLTELVLDHLEDVLPVEIREDENFCRELNIAVSAVITVDAHTGASDDEAKEIFHNAVARLSEIHGP